MPVGFDVNAQVRLGSPSNLKAVVAQIQSSFSSITANVKVNTGYSATNLNNLGRSLGAFSNNLNKATKDVVGFASAMNRMNSSIQAVQGNFSRLAGSARTVSAAMNTVQKSSQSVANSVKTIGTTLGETTRKFLSFSVAATVVAGVAVSLKRGADSALEFDRELVRIKQVSEGSTVGIKGISDEISRLSTSLGVSSAALVKTATTLRQAGLSALETKKSLELLAQTELAPTFDGIEKTVEGIIAINRQFSLSGEDLRKTFSSINTVSAAWAIESSDVVEATVRAGGAFAKAGGNFREFLALLTAVRSTTRESAETISTGFRTIFARLQRPATQKKLKDLIGVDLTDKGQFIGPYQAIIKLQQALNGIKSTDTRFAQVAEEVGGIRQIAKTIPLLKEGALALEVYNKAKDGFDKDSLKNDSATAQEALLVRLTKLQEKFALLFRTISDSTAFRAFINTAIELTSKLLDLANAVAPIIPIIASVAAFKIAGSIKGFAGDYKKGLLGHAKGGIVPGVGNMDTVPAALVPGSFVLNKKSTQNLNSLLTPGEMVLGPQEAAKIGYDNLHRLNKLERFGDGGKKTKREEYLDKIHAEKFLKGEVQGINKYELGNAGGFDKSEYDKIRSEKERMSRAIGLSADPSQIAAANAQLPPVIGGNYDIGTPGLSVVGSPSSDVGPYDQHGQDVYRVSGRMGVSQVGSDSLKNASSALPPILGGDVTGVPYTPGPEFRLNPINHTPINHSSLQTGDIPFRDSSLRLTPIDVAAEKKQAAEKRKNDEFQRAKDKYNSEENYRAGAPGSPLAERSKRKSALSNAEKSAIIMRDPRTNRVSDTDASTFDLNTLSGLNESREEHISRGGFVPGLPSRVGRPSSKVPFGNAVNSLKDRFGAARSSVSGGIGGIKGRLSGPGIALAGLAAPGIASYALGTAEQPGLLGQTGAHVGSALGGAAAGASVGSVAGPLGAIVGGVAGAASALAGFNEDIKNVQMKKFSEGIDLALSSLEKNGKFSSPEEAAKFRSDSKGLSDKINQTNTNGVSANTHLGETFLNPKIIASAIGSTLKAVGSSALSTASFGHYGSSFSKSLQDSAEGQEGENVKARQELAQPNFDRLSNLVAKAIQANPGQSLQDLKKGAGTKDLFAAFDQSKLDVKPVDAAAATARITSLIAVTKAETALAAKTIALINDIDSFGEKIKLAGDLAGKSFEAQSVSHDAFDGKISAGINRTNVGALGGIGKELQDYSTTGGGYDQSRENLRKALQSVPASDTNSESISQQVEDKLRNTNGFSGDAKSIGRNQLESVSHQLAGEKGSEILTQFRKGDQDGALDALTSIGKSLKEKGGKATEDIQHAMELFGKAAIGLAEDQVKIRDSQNTAFQVGIDRRSSVRNTANQLSDFNPIRVGRRGDNFLTREQVNSNENYNKATSSFISSQSIRFGVSGAEGVSANALGGKINRGQQLVRDLTNKQVAQAAGGAPLADQQKTATELVKATSEVANFTNALKTLAGSTEQLDAAQKQLEASLNAELADKASRQSDAQIRTFGSAKDKQQLVKAQYLQQVAAQQGNLNGFSDENKALLLNRLQQNKGEVNSQVQYDKYGREKRKPLIYKNEDLYNQLINPNTAASNLPQGTLDVNGRRVQASADVVRDQNKVNGLSRRGQGAQDVITNLQTQDTAAKRAELNSNALDFNKNTEKTAGQLQAEVYHGFQKSVVLMNTLSQDSPLIQAMNSFPKSLQIERSGTVQVILNGAEVVAKIKGDLEGYITERIISAITTQLPKALKEIPG